MTGRTGVSVFVVVPLTGSVLLFFFHSVFRQYSDTHCILHFPRCAADVWSVTVCSAVGNRLRSEELRLCSLWLCGVYRAAAKDHFHFPLICR